MIKCNVVKKYNAIKYNACHKTKRCLHKIKIIVKVNLIIKYRIQRTRLQRISKELAHSRSIQISGW
jgi:hypothetical protein